MPPALSPLFSLNRSELTPVPGNTHPQSRRIPITVYKSHGSSSSSSGGGGLNTSVGSVGGSPARDQERYNVHDTVFYTIETPTSSTKAVGFIQGMYIPGRGRSGRDRDGDGEAQVVCEIIPLYVSSDSRGGFTLSPWTTPTPGMRPEVTLIPASRLAGKPIVLSHYLASAGFVYPTMGTSVLNSTVVYTTSPEWEEYVHHRLSDRLNDHHTSTAKLPEEDEEDEEEESYGYNGYGAMSQDI